LISLTENSGINVPTETQRERERESMCALRERACVVFFAFSVAII
jgi:hypothetical protein